VTGIPSLEKACEVYRVLLDAFRARFLQTKNALSSSEYTQILRELRLHPRARLNPDPAMRVFNRMEETLNVRQ